MYSGVAITFSSRSCTEKIRGNKGEGDDESGERRQERRIDEKKGKEEDERKQVKTRGKGMMRIRERSRKRGGSIREEVKRAVLQEEKRMRKRTVRFG